MPYVPFTSQGSSQSKKILGYLSISELVRDGVRARATNPVSIEEEEVRNEHQGCANRSKNGQHVVNTDTPINGASCNSEAPRYDVSRHYKHGKSGCSAGLVCVDDVQMHTDKDSGDTEADHRRRNDR